MRDLPLLVKILYIFCLIGGVYAYLKSCSCAGCNFIKKGLAYYYFHTLHKSDFQTYSSSRQSYVKVLTTFVKALFAAKNFEDPLEWAKGRTEV